MKKTIFNSTLVLIIIATLYSCGKVPPSVGAPIIREATKEIEKLWGDEPTTIIENCRHCGGSGGFTDGYYIYPCEACGGDGVVVIIENQKQNLFNKH